MGPARRAARRDRCHLRQRLPRARGARRRGAPLRAGPSPPAGARRAAGRACPRGRGRPGQQCHGGDRPSHSRRAARARGAPVPVRPQVPVPCALDGALAVRRADRGPRPQHPDQLRVREHHAGDLSRRGLDRRRPLPAGDRHRRRRCDERRPAGLARRRVPRDGRRGHRRGRDGGGAAVRQAPARHDPGHGRGRAGRGERRCGARARCPADLRGARCRHREQCVPWHPAGCGAHRRGHGSSGASERSTRRGSRLDGRRTGLRVPRDLHAGAWWFCCCGDTRSAPGVRRRCRPHRHRQHQGRHRPPDGCRPGRCRRGEGVGDRHRAARRQLPGGGPRAGFPQPVARWLLPGALRAASGSGLRLTDQHGAAALDPTRRRPPSGPRRVGLCVPHHRSGPLVGLVASHLGSGGAADGDRAASLAHRRQRPGRVGDPGSGAPAGGCTAGRCPGRCSCGGAGRRCCPGCRAGPRCRGGRCGPGCG